MQFLKGGTLLYLLDIRHIYILDIVTYIEGSLLRESVNIFIKF